MIEGTLVAKVGLAGEAVVLVVFLKWHSLDS
jgi:hypothetical protein